MSGGKFGYQDYNIRIIADHIEEEVIMSGKPIPKQNWDYSMIHHPETAVNPSYEESTLLRMAEAVYALKKAEIYAHRVDYLLSGDDGEENFETRLKRELKELDAKSKMGENGVMYFVIDRTLDPYAEDD